MQEPYVSVFVTTYDHEDYIAEALDSVLCQKASFPFEICISDDHSHDSTCEIIKEYCRKYSFIRLNENSENLGIPRNTFLVRSMCRGKYIVDLQGDDYWIDEYKIEKQARFLDEHPEYIAVTTACEVRADNDKKALSVTPAEKYCDREFTLQDFLNGDDFQFGGIMMRNVYANPETRDFFALMPQMSDYIDDLTDELLLHLTGRTYTMSDRTAVYRIRVQERNDHNYTSINRGIINFRKHIDLLNNLGEQFPDIDLSGRYVKTIGLSFLTAVKYRQLKEFNVICDSISARYRRKHVKWRGIVSVPRHIISRVINKR